MTLSAIWRIMVMENRMRRLATLAMRPDDIYSIHIRHGIGEESYNVVPKSGGNLTRLEL
jgi:hypothetical protein